MRFATRVADLLDPERPLLGDALVKAVYADDLPAGFRVLPECRAAMATPMALDGQGELVRFFELML